ncbi:MAG: PD-(D/E)XK nuclease family transposase [Selenomonadaceae bacterium]|nr:PD-(D/E)XK nuclease family transposase [Selenomonadaceae bacterium]
MAIDYFKAVQELNLLDDVLMTVVFKDDTELTEFVLKIILNLDLKVTSVKVQDTLKNLKGRSVRLDIHAISEDGKHFNIEIQRQDKGAGAKRARYNSSLIDANTLSEGEDVDDLPETYVIFITERDVLKLNEPIYFIERMIVGKDKFFNDEEHIVYVNNSFQDDTPLGRLMHDFSCASPNEMFYREVADKIRPHKEDETEMIKVAGVMERIKEQAIREQAIDIAKKMIARGKTTLEEIAEDLSLPLEKVQELAATISPTKNIN